MQGCTPTPRFLDSRGGKNKNDLVTLGHVFPWQQRSDRAFSAPLCQSRLVPFTPGPWRHRAAGAARGPPPAARTPGFPGGQCQSASCAGSPVEGCPGAAAPVLGVGGRVDRISAPCDACCIQGSKGHGGAALRRAFCVGMTSLPRVQSSRLLSELL